MARAIVEDGVACPACGRRTLSAEGAGQICSYCGWDDDPRQRLDPNFAGGSNGIMLREARANVDNFGVAFPPSEAGGS